MADQLTPEPVDMWVGGRKIRWWDEPLRCTHADKQVCPACTDLTDAEAQAIRQYIELQRRELDRKEGEGQS